MPGTRYEVMDLSRLTSHARAALLEAAGRVGAHVPAVSRIPMVCRELQSYGFINSHYSLSARGLAARDQLVREAPAPFTRDLLDAVLAGDDEAAFEDIASRLNAEQVDRLLQAARVLESVCEGAILDRRVTDRG